MSVPTAAIASMCAALLGAAAIADFDLSWHRIAGGGATASTSGGYELGGTIGQHEAGSMSGGGYTLSGGFWAGGSVAPAPICPGDFNGDDFVDVFDLIELINHWGPCADPTNCPHDIAPAPGGDGVVDVFDLIELINNWGPCP